jgi:hypothetical protein
MHIFVGLGIHIGAKMIKGACLAADRSYSQVLAQHLAQRLAQLRTSRRLRETNDERHMHETQQEPRVRTKTKPPNDRA